MMRPVVLEIINPVMCERCRFKHNMILTDSTGLKIRIIQCTRGDCDNHVNTTLQTIDEYVAQKTLTT